MHHRCYRTTRGGHHYPAPIQQLRWADNRPVAARSDPCRQRGLTRAPPTVFRIAGGRSISADVAHATAPLLSRRRQLIDGVPIEAIDHDKRRRHDGAVRDLLPAYLPLPFPCGGVSARSTGCAAHPLSGDVYRRTQELARSLGPGRGWRYHLAQRRPLGDQCLSGGLLQTRTHTRSHALADPIVRERRMATATATRRRRLTMNRTQPSLGLKIKSIG
jgi:hypothetical protein